MIWKAENVFTCVHLAARSTMMGLYNVDPQKAGFDMLDLFQSMSGIFQLVWQSLSVGLAVVRPSFGMLRTPAQRKATALRRKVHDVMRGVVQGSDDALKDVHSRGGEDFPTVFTQLSEFYLFPRAPSECR